jgi:hypothetical protein
MRTAALCVAALLASASALAQGAGEGQQKLAACALPSHAERMACLAKLGSAAPPGTPQPLARPSPASSVPASPATASRAAPPAAGDWVISETRSPIDYSPVAIATASAGTGSDRAVLQLSIHCRGGRAEMVLRNAPTMHRAEDYVVTYAVNDAPPMTLAIGPSATGSGLAFKGEVRGFLASLPEAGNIAFRIVGRQSEEMEGRFALAGMKVLLGRMSGPCGWPIAARTPGS